MAHDGLPAQDRPQVTLVTQSRPQTPELVDYCQESSSAQEPRQEPRLTLSAVSCFKLGSTAQGEIHESAGLNMRLVSRARCGATATSVF